MVALALSATLVIGCSGLSRADEHPADPNILQQLRSFATMGSVLYIAAHPDDEPGARSWIPDGLSVAHAR